MQDWFNTQKSINIIKHDINKIKGNNYTTISIETEKALDEVP